MADDSIINDFFREANAENASFEPETIADRIVSDAEYEFKSYSEEEQSRLNEEEKLKGKIKRLQNKLRKCKNIKNPRLQHINADRSRKRKEINRKIEECKLRLQEIGDERQGAEIAPEQFLQTSPPTHIGDDANGIKGLSNWNSIM